MAPFWFLLALLLSSVSTNDGAIAYVKPFDSSNLTCPEQPCLTLNEYAREKDRYFLNGRSFIFLSGVHQLDIPLRLEYVSNISFEVLLDDYVQILLSPWANITWSDCNNITITGLEVYLSGVDNTSFFSSLTFQCTTSSLSRMSFFGNDSLQSTAIRTHTSVVNLNDLTVVGATSKYGAALFAFNSTINIADQSYFVNNTATQGGAIVIIQSTGKLSGNISFDNNIAFSSSFSTTALGGAIYCENSVLLFRTSVLFQQNHAVSFYAQGGGILAHLNSVLTFETSSNVVFTENSAMFVGGAILVSETNLTMHGKTLFDSNFAGYQFGGGAGGALRGEANSKICLNGTEGGITFRNNYMNMVASSFSSGGAISTSACDVVLDQVLFKRNTAGASAAIDSSDLSIHIMNCDFYNNSATQNAAIHLSGIRNGIATFDGMNNFQWNSATIGIVLVSSVNVSFSGENNFLNNIVTQGSGILSLSTVSSSFICGNLTFYRNEAFNGAGLYGLLSNVIVCGYTSFIENSAASLGGGMMFFMCNLNITGQAYFIQNTARYGSAMYITGSNGSIGGSINISSHGSLRFSGSPLSINNTMLQLTGVLILENNTGYEGGAINVRDSELTVFGCIQCLNNLARRRGGALYARNSRVSIRNNDSCNTFQTNIADERGGAFYARDSTISLSGSQMFLNNSASQGGAMAIDSNSKLVLNEPLQASFVENDAAVGGAIFYEDVFSASQCSDDDPMDPDDRITCFIEIDSRSNIQLNFIKNVAESAGTVLYGGNLDRCRLFMGEEVVDSCGNRIGGSYSDIAMPILNNILNITSNDNITSDISSDPLQVCFCENDILYCSNTTIDTIRGTEFTLIALIVGQNRGSIPSSVRTSLDSDIQIRATQRIQDTGRQCTPITYHLSSSKNTTALVLFPDGPCRDTGISRRQVTINFLPCPDGFTLDGSDCVCEERLQRYTNSCSVDDSSIQRDSNTFWMGAVFENETYEGLILHSGCPFDHCIDSPVAVKLDNLDIQCSCNRSGILCGSCVTGYSITFGTLHCLYCNNAYLALLLPFALAGIVLVAFLLLLNMSVASGTINGLIFYANVIQVNRSIFFPPGETNILTVFIAWLNLDLGIETCFYDGMNAYIFTWLQFIFPLYVWFLIGLMIMLSRVSTRVARALGRNPVAALATLFLLSYSKILRTIIVALSFTILEYPGNTHQAVWLYDGNISYFQSGSHIILGTVAIVVLLFLFLPYTLLLLCGHWLQACSDNWMLSWLNKIMPLMDAYHAPYNKKSRYWTGLLLLLRCALFLTFAFNTLGNDSGNLLAIVSVTAGLMIVSWLRVKIYKNVFNDFLEATFLLNLCILAAGTYHVREIRGNQAGLAYTSVGIAFILLICILLYHMYLRLQTTILWKKMHAKRHYILDKISWSRKNENNIEGNIVNIKQKSEMVPVQLPTVTIIELDACEPLLT